MEGLGPVEHEVPTRGSGRNTWSVGSGGQESPVLSMSTDRQAGRWGAGGNPRGWGSSLELLLSPRPPPSRARRLLEPSTPWVAVPALPSQAQELEAILKSHFSSRRNSPSWWWPPRPRSFGLSTPLPRVAHVRGGRAARRWPLQVLPHMSQLQALAPGEGSRLADYCAGAMFVQQLLTRGYGFDERAFGGVTFQKKVGDGGPGRGWAGPPGLRRG